LTLFYPASKELHPRQAQSQAMGAELRGVPMGFVANCCAKARSFAAQEGAFYLPLGFDVPEARRAYTNAALEVRAALPFFPEEIYCASGTATLARCIAAAFPESKVIAVGVGLASSWHKIEKPANLTIVASRFKSLAQRCKAWAPFPIDPHYEAKAWEVCQQSTRPRLFWNVIGGL